MKNAEAGTGYMWEYMKNKTTPRERLAKTVEIHHLQLEAVYFTRLYKGLNYFEIHQRLSDSKDSVSVSDVLKTMPGIVKEEATSASVAAFGSNAMDEYNADTSFKNMPSCIFDNNNNRWDKLFTYDTCAVYRNHDLGEETITSCSISGKSAYGYGRNFHWY